MRGGFEFEFGGAAARHTPPASPRGPDEAGAASPPATDAHQVSRVAPARQGRGTTAQDPPAHDQQQGRDPDVVAAECRQCQSVLSRRRGRGRPRVLCDTCKASRQRAKNHRDHQRKRRRREEQGEVISRRRPRRPAEQGQAEAVRYYPTLPYQDEPRRVTFLQHRGALEAWLNQHITDHGFWLVRCGFASPTSKWYACSGWNDQAAELRRRNEQLRRELAAEILDSDTAERLAAVSLADGTPYAVRVDGALKRRLAVARSDAHQRYRTALRVLAQRALQAKRHFGCRYAVHTQERDDGRVVVREFGYHNESCRASAATDLTYQPLHPQLESWIVDQLRVGVPPLRILQRVNSPQDLPERLAPPRFGHPRRERYRVCAADIGRLRYRLQRVQQRNSGDQRATLAALANLALNDPEAVLFHQHQLVSEEGGVERDFLLVLQPLRMRQRAAQVAGLPQGRHFFLDATGSLNRYGFMMFTVMTVDEAGSGLPVAVAITEKKGAQTIYTFLRHVFDANPHYQPLSFMIDMDEAEANAVKQLAQHLQVPIAVRWCWFHVKQCVRDKVPRGTSVERASVNLAFHRMRLATSVRELHVEAAVARTLVESLRGPSSRVPDDAVRKLLKLINALLAVPERWTVQIGRQRLESPFDHATNNILERHHRTFKAEFLGHRRTRRIDDLIRAILAYDHSLERHATDRRGATSGHARGRRTTLTRLTSGRQRDELQKRMEAASTLWVKGRVRDVDEQRADNGSVLVTATVVGAGRLGMEAVQQEEAAAVQEEAAAVQEAHQQEETHEQEEAHEQQEAEQPAQLAEHVDPEIFHAARIANVAAAQLSPANIAARRWEDSKVLLDVDGCGTVRRLECAPCHGSMDSLPCRHMLAVLLAANVEVKGLDEGLSLRTDSVRQPRVPRARVPTPLGGHGGHELRFLLGRYSELQEQARAAGGDAEALGAQGMEEGTQQLVASDGPFRRPPAAAALSDELMRQAAIDTLAEQGREQGLGLEADVSVQGAGNGELEVGPAFGGGDGGPEAPSLTSEDEISDPKLVAADIFATVRHQDSPEWLGAVLASLARHFSGRLLELTAMERVRAILRPVHAELNQAAASRSRNGVRGDYNAHHSGNHPGILAMERRDAAARAREEAQVLEARRRSQLLGDLTTELGVRRRSEFDSLHSHTREKRRRIDEQQAAREVAATARRLAVSVRSLPEPNEQTAGDG